MRPDRVWLEGTHPTNVSDAATCCNCGWRTFWRATDKGKSKTLARAKAHVRSTGHKVEYRQSRFGLIKLPDPKMDI